MPKYLFKASYSSEGAQGLKSKGGSSRSDAVAHMAEGLGGSLESFYFAFGGTDGYVVVDLPDNEAAAACGLTINSGSAVKVETVVLLSPEELDEAAQRSVDYRPPGS